MIRRGILFYCDHDQPVAALAVALRTLLRSYSGPIHLVLGPMAPNWLLAEISQNGSALNLTFEQLVGYDFGEWTKGRQGAWCQKLFAIRRRPFDVTLAL